MHGQPRTLTLDLRSHLLGGSLGLRRFGPFKGGRGSQAGRLFAQSAHLCPELMPVMTAIGHASLGCNWRAGSPDGVARDRHCVRVRVDERAFPGERREY